MFGNFKLSFSNEDLENLLAHQFAFLSLEFNLTIDQEMAADPTEFIYTAMKLQHIKPQTNMEHMQIINMKS